MNLSYSLEDHDHMLYIVLKTTDEQTIAELQANGFKCEVKSGLLYIDASPKEGQDDDEQFAEVCGFIDEKLGEEVYDVVPSIGDSK